MTWAKATGAAMVCAALAGLAAAPEREGPLAGLPDGPGPQAEKIKALADGEWLNLGAPESDPKWGRACGRSWACRMAFAPDLRGAFLFGEGVHGFVKEDGRVMDDLWFYDLQKHSWICCYPGAEVKTIELKINTDGFEVDKDGRPVPLSTMAHAYEMTTYDGDAKRFLSMPCPNEDYLNRAIKERRGRWRKEQPKTKPKGAGPWTFETATGRWDRRPTETIGPTSGFGDTFIYVPTKKQDFFRHLDEVWFYDGNADKWDRVSPTGPKLPFGIDATSCYDSKRDRIYLGGGSYPNAPAGTNALWVYDLKTDAWVDPHPDGAPCKGSTSYATNNAILEYDSVNDVVLLIRHGGKEEERGVFVYDPATNAWTAAAKPLPAKWDRSVNAFYDPVWNVHFFHVAGDSRDDGVMWVYRYRNAKK